MNTTRLENLKKIELDHNRLSKLDLEGVMLDSLESLDCTHNSLKIVHGLSSSKLPSIKRISLEHNKLMTFNIENSPLSYHSLELLNLEDN